MSQLTAAGIYLALVAIASTAAVIAYRVDKRRAKAGGRRVPERTLHLIALAGGWPGALFASRHFRHKTQKVRFRVVFWLTVLLHLAAVGLVVWAVTSGRVTFH